MGAKTAQQVLPRGGLESLQGAAADLGVSVRTMRRRIADGTLHVCRVGRLIRVDVDELRRDMLVVIGSAR